MNNAYLYGHLDTDIIMEQLTDSSQKEAKPRNVCKSSNLSIEQNRLAEYGALS